MARPLGSQNKDKPFREALRMELAAAGDSLKELRQIARAHSDMAKGGDMAAIKELADRLDGKPAQEATITHLHDVAELTDRQIAERIAELRGTEPSDGDTAPPLDPSQLN